MRVSVICPVHDTVPGLLLAAARAVLGEVSGQVCQLILSDDASGDPGTLAALATLAAEDARVVVHRAARNAGPARARNVALALAAGDWVAFTDADDLWLPDHLMRVSAVLALAPAAGWVSANHALLHRDGTRTASALLSDTTPGERIVAGVLRYGGPAATRALIGTYWLHLGGCTVRTDLARAAGGFAEACLYSEDWLFFLCLSTLTDLYYVEQATYLLRRQHASLTTSARRLTHRRADGKRAALAHPALTPFRPELRWALRSTYKGLAATNLLAGHRTRAAGFAWRAFAMDPREMAEAVRFLRLACIRDDQRLRQGLPGYSAVELPVAPDPNS